MLLLQLLQTCPKYLIVLTMKIFIAKLIVYGFDSPSLQFISAYLNFRKQKTKVSSTFSIMFGVPQNSTARKIFFNIYTCDMFFQIDTSEFSKYADDITPFASAQNHEKRLVKHCKWCVSMVSRKLL